MIRQVVFFEFVCSLQNVIPYHSKKEKTLSPRESQEQEIFCAHSNRVMKNGIFSATKPQNHKNTLENLCCKQKRKKEKQNNATKFRKTYSTYLRSLNICQQFYSNVWTA